MNLANYDRFETYTALARPIHTPIWIDRDLNLVVPKWWQRVIFSILGSLECVRDYFNIDYAYASYQLSLRRSAFSDDPRLVDIFNRAVRNFNTVSGKKVPEMVVPPKKDNYSLTEKEAFTLQNVLRRHGMSRASDLLHVNPYSDPEINTPEGLRLLLKNCPNLQDLILPEEISDDLFLVLAPYAKQLTQLSLPKTTGLSDKSLELLTKFTNLTYLRISNLTLDSRLAAIVKKMDRHAWQKVYIYGVDATELVFGIPEVGVSVVLQDCPPYWYFERERVPGP